MCSSIESASLSRASASWERRRGSLDVSYVVRHFEILDGVVGLDVLSESCATVSTSCAAADGAVPTTRCLPHRRRSLRASVDPPMQPVPASSTSKKRTETNLHQRNGSYADGHLVAVHVSLNLPARPATRVEQSLLSRDSGRQDHLRRRPPTHKNGPELTRCIEAQPQCSQPLARQSTLARRTYRTAGDFARHVWMSSSGPAGSNRVLTLRRILACMIAHPSRSRGGQNRGEGIP